MEHKRNRRVRNATCTTVAPTGSISRAADCSSSIEPVFAFTIQRKTVDEKEFIYLHPLLEELGTKQGWLTAKVRALLVQGTHPKDIPQIPEKLRNVLVTAHEIAPEKHVIMQAKWQANIDNAISKTVNMVSTAKKEDVDKAFRLAYQLRCKGVTVYRDGCRKGQVLTTVNASPAVKDTASTPILRPRPAKTTGTTIRKITGCGKLYITINFDSDGKLFEIFVNLSRGGGCPSQCEATARLASLLARYSTDPQELIENLKGIRCLATVTRRKGDSAIDVLSCPDAIARAIEEALGTQLIPPASLSTTDKCPTCESNLRYESGCNICDNCGYSKCG